MRSLADSLMLDGGGVVSLVGAGGKTTILFRIARELAHMGRRVLSTTTTKMTLPSSAHCPAVVVSPSPETVLRRATRVLRAGGQLFAAAATVEGTPKVSGFPPEVIDAFWQSGLFQWILVEADGASRKPLKAPAAHEPVVPASTRWLVAVVGLDGVGRPLNEASVFRAEIFSSLTGLGMDQVITPRSIVDALLHEEGGMKGCPARAVRFAFLNKADVAGGAEAAEEIVGILTPEGRGRLHRVVVGQAALDPPVLGWADLGHGREG